MLESAINGRPISSNYLTTVTRSFSGAHVAKLYTRLNGPGFSFRFVEKINSNNTAYVRFSHYNLEYMSWVRIDFAVSPGGNIYVK